jgi:hypothetical protein
MQAAASYKFKRGRDGKRVRIVVGKKLTRAVRVPARKRDDQDASEVFPGPGFMLPVRAYAREGFGLIAPRGPAKKVIPAGRNKK